MERILPDQIVVIIKTKAFGQCRPPPRWNHNLTEINLSKDTSVIKFS